MQSACKLGVYALFVLSIPFFLAGVILIPPVLILGALAIWFCFLHERSDETEKDTWLMRVEFFTIIFLTALSFIASLPDAIVLSLGMLFVKGGDALRHHAYMPQFDPEF